jgi:Tfp pilus assembly protein FimT
MTTPTSDVRTLDELLREHAGRLDAEYAQGHIGNYSLLGFLAAFLAAVSPVIRQQEREAVAEEIALDLAASRADAERMRQELAAIADAIGDDPAGDWTDLAARVAQDWAEMVGMRNQYYEERERMRSVVEAARAAARTNPHSAFPEVVQVRLAERAAVDTYETGGTE